MLPSHAISLIDIALAHHRAGRLREAADAYEAILRNDPGDGDALHGLGLVAHQVGQHAQAANLIARAIQRHPTAAHLYADLGLSQYPAGQPDAAVANLRTAVRLQPDVASHHFNLGYVLHSSHQFTEAAQCYESALTLDPAHIHARSNLAVMLQTQGQVEEAIVHLRRAVEMNPNSASIHSNLLLAMHYPGTYRQAEMFAAHVGWARQHADKFADPLPFERLPMSGGRKLRIGLMSPDFRRHPVATFIEPFLKHHDRDRFEIFCYADLGQPDDTTARLRTYAHQWRSAMGMSDEQLTRLIRSDQLDFLVDLAGHTSASRLLVLARRAAHVQATAIGYPDTTGVRNVDFRITDSIADPPGIADTLHTERLLRLPGCFLCWQPPTENVDVAAPPALRNGFVTFGSFNNIAKLSSFTLELWARILMRLPEARMLIKAPGMSTAARAQISDAFAAHSVDPRRLLLRPASASYAEHLAMYNEIDIALDPIPYNGTTTVCEALWMGVPVVTKRGEAHVSRVAASLLTATDMHDNITESDDAYVERATSIADDLQSLAARRLVQRERLAGSSLLDGSSYARKFEHCIEAVLQPQNQQA